MSKQAEAELILHLYELRREETMRKARDWFFRDFNPDTFDDFQATLFGPHSGHMRMVITYWDMAAALVNNGAISLDLFNDANGEQYGVFAKIDHILPEIRKTIGPLFAVNLEKLIDATPGGRERLAQMKERIKMIRAQLAQSAQAQKA